MGCDIESYVEIKKKDTWEKVGDYFSLFESEKKLFKKDKIDMPFRNRNYSLFGFLADVRNYDQSTPLSPPKGLPLDISKDVFYKFQEWENDNFAASFFTLKELLDFDYEQKFWNKRMSTRDSYNQLHYQKSGVEKNGVLISYRKNLGENYFDVLNEMLGLGSPQNIRVVFWFSN